ncbi:MAG: hypothetical protein LBU80_02425 [Rikenellaceae bacterium]|jgi:DNA repair exonuclease SbcCD ATPase subunit|nr:hypothetical protein [Rikenellaceae bacterium]
MKKIAVLGLVLVTMFSCVSRKSADKDLAEQKDSLSTIISAKDSIINDVFASVNVIAENLNAIKEREGMVQANSQGEVTKEKRTQINEDIAAIGTLLAQNRAAVNRLKGSTEQLRKANIKITELEQLVTNLNQQVDEKNADISALREDLGKLSIQVMELNTSVEDLTETKTTLETVVSQQTDALNTAFYLVGPEKQLQAAGIVEKSGFIGRTLKLTAGYDIDQFTRIDVTKVDRVLVGQKKATIVSNHPEGSYELVMSDGDTCEMLLIKDPKIFWSASKVLLISYK